MKHFLPLTLLIPVAAYAQAPSNFRGLVSVLLDIISVLIPLVFTLTLIVIIWGITKAWILRAGDEAEVEKGKTLVFTGVIVLVIMSGIWGILALLRQGLFG